MVKKALGMPWRKAESFRKGCRGISEFFLLLEFLNGSWTR
jgi:hypothetical protein